MAVDRKVGPRRLRRVKQGKHIAYQLFLPPSQGENIPDGALFTPELTDDGILFKFSGFEQEVEPDEVPAWAKPEKA